MPLAHAADRPARTQFVATSVIVSLVAVLAVLAAPLAGRHVPGTELAVGALMGGDTIMDVMIAMLLYSCGRIAGDAASVTLGNLFLFSGGFFVVQGLHFAGASLGFAVLVGTAAESGMWVIWTAMWLCGVATYAWTADPARERGPIKRQVGRMVLTIAIAVLLTGLGYRLAATLRASGWIPDIAVQAALPLLGVLTVIAWIGVTRRLARHSVGGLWLAVILVVGLMDIALRALSDGQDSFGYYAGTAALLTVKMLAFTSLFRGLVTRFARMSEANDTLEMLAHHDALTGLANRRRFDQRLMMEWRRCARDRVPLALVLIDVDKFKQYNDSYGHPAGDDCLVKVAGLLGAYIRRPADLAARYGGEEFALLLPGTDASGAARLAERIRLGQRRLAIPHEGSAKSVVTLSAGVASLVPSGSERQSSRLLQAADRALYRAKESGRDRVEVETPIAGRAKAAGRSIVLG